MFTTLSVICSTMGLGGEFCPVGAAGIHVQNEAAVGQSVNRGSHHGLVLEYG